MNFVEVIETKKKGFPLTDEQITAFARGAAVGSVPDYQLAALLMAIRLNGMTDAETTALTIAMANSGDQCDLSMLKGIPVDKHSTGGVGDTTTLVLAPLVAACGGIVAKMSGRGLGHTGGTLDKMESIEGLSVSLTQEAFIKQINEIGIAVIGQTADLAPADKTLYALRDVTATVDSLPLIASSIMSKKIASGSQAIVLDVKCGAGALMKTPEDAIALAEIMVHIGCNAGRKVVAVVSSMDQPLGTHVGNALEVKEAIDILQGKTTGDLLTVSLFLGGYMLYLSSIAPDLETGIKMMKQHLQDKSGLEKLRAMIHAQGGNSDVCDNVELLPKAKVLYPVKAWQEGYIYFMDTVALGNASRALGAGRQRKEDIIDPSVGFVMEKRIGQKVNIGDVIAVVHARSEEDAIACEKTLMSAIAISDKAPDKKPLIIATVTNDCVNRFD